MRHVPPARPRGDPIEFNGNIAIRRQNLTGIGLAYPTPNARGTVRKGRFSMYENDARAGRSAARRSWLTRLGAVVAHLFIFFDRVLRAIFPAFDHRSAVLRSGAFLYSVTAGGRPLRRAS